MRQEIVIKHLNVLPEHTRLSQTDIVKGEKPKPINDPHENIPNHVRRLQHESNLNDIFVKRLSLGVKELKRDLGFRKFANTMANDLFEQWQSVGFRTNHELFTDIKAQLEKDASHQAGLEEAEIIMDTSLQGKRPDWSDYGKDQPKPNR
jgi:hypothetical protein